MKKTIAISFLLIFLNTHTAFGQIMRFPVLIHHFLEHEKENKDLSFIKFLSQHYSTKINHPDNNHNDHEDLPFKSDHCQVIKVLTGDPIHLLSFSYSITEPDGTKNFIRNQSYCSDAFLNSIWQPPRFS